MPRSDKPISRGSLTDPIVSARSQTWSSHADPEDSDQLEPDGASFVDPLRQEPVAAVVSLVNPKQPVVTVRVQDQSMQRGAFSPMFVVPPVYEWMMVRSIEGRTYMRLDERYQVDPEG
jgi:hypothetical protein